MVNGFNFDVLLSQNKADKPRVRLVEWLREAGLPKLLSGELRVPAAAKLVEATA